MALVAAPRTFARQVVLRTFVRNLSERAKELRTKALLDKIIRVDHAGETGAKRIYQGQLAVLGNTPTGPLIQEMQEEEEKHLAEFERLMKVHRARPTVFMPLWDMAGFALGAGSALLGKEGAMACTVAVETVIGEHYNSQIRDLMEDDPVKHETLLKTLKEFRDDELHHHDIGLENDAEKAPLYKAMTQAIKIGCRGAIWVAEKL